MKLRAGIDVLAGAFASQPLAFAHLHDAAARLGLSPDLDHVDVIAPPYGRRLGACFDGGTCSTIAAAATGDTVILVLPGALVTGGFQGDGRMRRIGRFTVQITRAALA